jgi:hypothetical protein
LPTDIHRTLQLTLEKSEIRPANRYLRDSPLILSSHVKDTVSEETIEVKKKGHIYPFDLSRRENSIHNFDKL